MEKNKIRNAGQSDIIYERSFPTRKYFAITVILFIIVQLQAIASETIKIRLYTEKYPTSATLAVISGSYTIDSFNGTTHTHNVGDYLSITLTKDKLAVKTGSEPAYWCDSIQLTQLSDKGIFSLRVNGDFPVKREYSGNLSCKADMGTMFIINEVGIDDYIAGVVRAEGGTGKHPEFLKTQAIIARTYMIKYNKKHILDGYNLCDVTHCQVYHGISDDEQIADAVLATQRLIIVDSDSIPILAAFHSNCGGETVPSEEVWLTPLPYLKKKTDVHCTESANAQWETEISLNEWIDYLRSKGYTGTDYSLLNFEQDNRSSNYTTGNFSYPLNQIRTDFGLRSTFFSVKLSGDKIFLAGKGYGHGVGLCQEGAMVMANNGYNFREIIDFYYSGVSIIESSGPSKSTLPLETRR